MCVRIYKFYLKIVIKEEKNKIVGIKSFLPRIKYSVIYILSINSRVLFLIIFEQCVECLMAIWQRITLSSAVQILP